MKSHEKLEIFPLEEKDRGVASYLLIYSALNELKDYINKIEQAGLAIKSGLIVRKFYKAVSDGKIIGLVSLSDTRSGFVELEYSEIKKQYGFFRAKKIFNILNNVFSVRDIPEGSGYITFPVSPESDSAFVVLELLKYVLSQGKYKRYYTFIAAGDVSKHELLKKAGFREYGYFDREKNSIKNEETAYYLLMEYSAEKQ